MAAPTTLGVKQIIDLLRLPADEHMPMLISAHRGLRWNGVPENSKAAVLNAAHFGLLCIEVDVRLTADGHAGGLAHSSEIFMPVVHHDAGLGRVTNITEHLGREDVYSPWTGKGYNPKVDSLPWKGVIEHLKLKDENGRITEHGILDLENLLKFIEEQELNIVVFLDVKSKAAVPVAASIISRHQNASRVPALEWCVFKLDVEWYSSPAELESAAWWQDASRIGTPLYIPVFEPTAYAHIDVLASAKAFAARPYCVALEVGVRSPGGPLQEVVDYATAAGLSLGFFAALGDVHPSDGNPTLIDTADVDLQDCRRPDGSLISFHEGNAPLAYNDELKGQSDERWDLNAYKCMGYTWAIADLTSRSASLFAHQAVYQQPLDREWQDRRLSNAAGTVERARM